MSNIDTDTDTPTTDADTSADDEVTSVPEDDVADAEAADADVDADLEVADAEQAEGEQAEGEQVEGEAGEQGDVEVVTDEELLDQQPVRAESPYDRPGRWFVVHTQSGYEKKVKQNLEARISSMNMEERIHEVVIPMEDVVEFKNGKKVVVPRKVFPGYLLVRCDLDDDSWYVIRNPPGIVNFVGQGGKPSPLSRREVETFLQVKVEGKEATPKRGKARLEYEVGETV